MLGIKNPASQHNNSEDTYPPVLQPLVHKKVFEDPVEMINMLQEFLIIELLTFYLLLPWSKETGICQKPRLNDKDSSN
jgi:hypothetical protein